MPYKRKKAKAKAKRRPAKRRTTTKRGGGLAGFRRFVKSKTIGATNAVTDLTRRLKAAKKKKAAATKKAQALYRKKHK